MRKALLEYVQAEGRICPMPMPWNELWEMLPDRKRSSGGWEPPPPLILSGWHYTSDEQKQKRLLDHIQYADEHGVLYKVDQFLRSLPEDEWLQRSKL